MINVFKASERASKIEYAIRDVVVPADKLETQGHHIIKLNLGGPALAIWAFHTYPYD
jgi:hypothetical protein